MKHSITYWSQMKKILGSFEMATTAIVPTATNISIANNVSIPGVDQDAERVEFVVQEERTKRKRNIRPIMSLDTSLGETNYDAFDPAVPKKCLESNIDKIPCK